MPPPWSVRRSRRQDAIRARAARGAAAPLRPGSSVQKRSPGHVPRAVLMGATKTGASGASSAAKCSAKARANVAFPSSARLVKQWIAWAKMNCAVPLWMLLGVHARGAPTPMRYAATGRSSIYALRGLKIEIGRTTVANILARGTVREDDRHRMPRPVRHLRRAAPVALGRDIYRSMSHRPLPPRPGRSAHQGPDTGEQRQRKHRDHAVLLAFLRTAQLLLPRGGVISRGEFLEPTGKEWLVVREV